MKEYHAFESKEEFEKFKRLDVEYLIKSIFTENSASFDGPTKEELLLVVNKLAEIARNFRSPAIIKKHYSEIKQLIDKL
jgi:hypothetical protein